MTHPPSLERASLGRSFVGTDASVTRFQRRCLKIEHRQSLGVMGLRSLAAVLEEAHRRYPACDWLILIEEPHPRDLPDALGWIRMVLPPQCSRRVAVVWIGCQGDCCDLKIGGLPQGCECRFFSSTFYHQAMAWIQPSSGDMEDLAVEIADDLTPSEVALLEAEGTVIGGGPGWQRP